MRVAATKISFFVLLGLPWCSGTAQTSEHNISHNVSGPERSANYSQPILPIVPGLPAQPQNPDLTNQPPEARLVFSQPSNYAPAMTLLTAGSSTDDQGIAAYVWDFGDGSVATGKTVQHEFLIPGNFLVTLTVSDDLGAQDTATELIAIARDPQQPLSDAEAARFLAQATFGTTTAAMAEVQSLGLGDWIEQQQNILGPAQANYYTDVPHGYSGSNDSGRHEIWWLSAVNGQDQLRNRVAFALTQFFVTSDVPRPLSISQVGMTRYYDLMRTQAFSNYRDLLGAVTLNPVMGVYLSMAGNEQTSIEEGVRPDENYAREILQLFSLGVYRLNLDGTEMRDASDRPIPNYDERIVKEFARIFTGWGPARTH